MRSGRQLVCAGAQRFIALQEYRMDQAEGKEELSSSSQTLNAETTQDSEASFSPFSHVVSLIEGGHGGRKATGAARLSALWWSRAFLHPLEELVLQKMENIEKLVDIYENDLNDDIEEKNLAILNKSKNNRLSFMKTEKKNVEILSKIVQLWRLWNIVSSYTKNEEKNDVVAINVSRMFVEWYRGTTLGCASDNCDIENNNNTHVHSSSLQPYEQARYLLEDDVILSIENTILITEAIIKFSVLHLFSQTLSLFHGLANKLRGFHVFTAHEEVLISGIISLLSCEFWDDNIQGVGQDDKDRISKQQIILYQQEVHRQWTRAAKELFICCQQCFIMENVINNSDKGMNLESGLNNDNEDDRIILFKQFCLRLLSLLSGDLESAWKGIVSQGEIEEGAKQLVMVVATASLMKPFMNIHELSSIMEKKLGHMYKKDLKRIYSNSSKKYLGENFCTTEHNNGSNHNGNFTHAQREVRTEKMTSLMVASNESFWWFYAGVANVISFLSDHHLSHYKQEEKNNKIDDDSANEDEKKECERILTCIPLILRKAASCITAPTHDDFSSQHQQGHGNVGTKSSYKNNELLHDSNASLNLVRLALLYAACHIADAFFGSASYITKMNKAPHERYSSTRSINTKDLITNRLKLFIRNDVMVDYAKALLQYCDDEFSFGFFTDFNCSLDTEEMKGGAGYSDSWASKKQVQEKVDIVLTGELLRGFLEAGLHQQSLLYLAYSPLSHPNEGLKPVLDCIVRQMFSVVVVYQKKAKDELSRCKRDLIRRPCDDLTGSNCDCSSTLDSIHSPDFFGSDSITKHVHDLCRLLHIYFICDNLQDHHHGEINNNIKTTQSNHGDETHSHSINKTVTTKEPIASSSALVSVAQKLHNIIFKALGKDTFSVDIQRLYAYQNAILDFTIYEIQFKHVFSLLKIYQDYTSALIYMFEYGFCHNKSTFPSIFATEATAINSNVNGGVIMGTPDKSATDSFTSLFRPGYPSPQEINNTLLRGGVLPPHHHHQQQRSQAIISLFYQPLFEAITGANVFTNKLVLHIGECVHYNLIPLINHQSIQELDQLRQKTEGTTSVRNIKEGGEKQQKRNIYQNSDNMNVVTDLRLIKLLQCCGLIYMISIGGGIAVNSFLQKSEPQYSKKIESGMLMDDEHNEQGVVNDVNSALFYLNVYETLREKFGITYYPFSNVKIANDEAVLKTVLINSCLLIDHFLDVLHDESKIILLKLIFSILRDAREQNVNVRNILALFINASRALLRTSINDKSDVIMGNELDLTSSWITNSSHEETAKKNAAHQHDLKSSLADSMLSFSLPLCSEDMLSKLLAQLIASVQGPSVFCGMRNEALLAKLRKYPPLGSSPVTGTVYEKNSQFQDKGDDMSEKAGGVGCMVSQTFASAQLVTLNENRNKLHYPNYGKDLHNYYRTDDIEGVCYGRHRWESYREDGAGATQGELRERINETELNQLCVEVITLVNGGL